MHNWNNNNHIWVLWAFKDPSLRTEMFLWVHSEQTVHGDPDYICHLGQNDSQWQAVFLPWSKGSDGNMLISLIRHIYSLLGWSVFSNVMPFPSICAGEFNMLCFSLDTASAAFLIHHGTSLTLHSTRTVQILIVLRKRSTESVLLHFNAPRSLTARAGRAINSSRGRREEIKQRER